MEHLTAPALTAGATLTLPPGPWQLAVPGPFDLAVVVLGEDGRVAGDADLVFHGQPAAGGVQLRGERVRVDPTGLRPGATRLVLLASPADETSSLGRLPAPALTVTTARGAPVARFTAAGLRTETVVQVAEVYRRGPAWRLRALGAGYDDGLAGLAREFGVEVDDAPAEAAPALTEVVALTNDERRARGLVVLTADRRLAAAAQAHNDDMVRRGFFAHECPDGSSVAERVRAAGYAFSLVAENLAAGQRTPAEVVQGWLDSPGHRANLLHRDVRQIGVGRTEGGPYGTTWTQVFGTPL